MCTNVLLEESSSEITFISIFLTATLLLAPGKIIAGGTGICVTPDGRNVPCSSGGGSSSGSSGSYSMEGALIQSVINGVSRGIQQAIEQGQRRERESRQYGNRLNDIALEHSRNGRHEEAISYYKQALQYNNSSVIRKNLRWEEGQLAFAKQKVDRGKLNDMMNDLQARWGEGGSNQPPPDMNFEGMQQSQGATMEFVAPGEPLFSKGSKTSSPVDLSSSSSNQPVILGARGKQPGPNQTEKGVKFKDVPNPVEVVPQWDPYSAKSRTEIVAEALDKGGRDLGRSTQFLQDYLYNHNRHNVKVKEALSYLEGLRAGSAEEELKKERGLFDPNKQDHYQLIPPQENASTGVWPGPKNPDPGARLPNPLDWRVQRANQFLEALEEGHGSWDRSFEHLQNKVKADPHDYVSQQALAYLQGFHSKLTPGEKK